MASSIEAILSDEVAQRLGEDPWDAEAWELALEEAGELDADRASQVFEACLVLYPRATHVWCQYVRKWLDVGEDDRAQRVLCRILDDRPSAGRGTALWRVPNPQMWKVPDPALWELYVEFVKRTKLEPREAALSAALSGGESESRISALRESVSEGRGIVGNAYRAATAAAGLIPGAERLWDGFVSYLDSGPGKTELERSQRDGAVMEVLRRAVGMPLPGIEERWRMFEERVRRVESSEAAAGKTLQLARISNRSARFVMSERSRHWEGLSTGTLSVPASPPLRYWLDLGEEERAEEEERVGKRVWMQTGQTACALDVRHGPEIPLVARSEGGRRKGKQLSELAGRWMVALEYEESNPLGLDAAALRKHMHGVYQLALSALLRFPDVWLGYVQAERRLAAAALKTDSTAAPSDADAIAVRAHEACPGSQTTGLLAAHALEELREARAAGKVYDQLVARCPGTAVFVDFLQFAQRATAGKDSGRAVRHIFAKRIQSHPRCTPEVFVAMAQMTSRSEAAAASATKTLVDEGRRRYPNHVPLALALSDVLARQNDFKNARALLESLLASLDSSGREDPSPVTTAADVRRMESARAVWDRYLDLETRWATEPGSLARVSELESRRQRALAPVESVLYPAHRSLHRFQQYGTLPSGPADTELLARRPYTALWFHGPEGERAVLRPVGDEGGLGHLPHGLLPVAHAPQNKGILARPLAPQALEAHRSRQDTTKEFLALLPAADDVRAPPAMRAAEIQHAIAILATLRLPGDAPPKKAGTKRPR